MSFGAPIMLWGLLLIPLVVALYALAQRRRMRYAMRFTNLDLLANVVTKTPRWRRHLPPVLFLLALSSLLVGLARPQATMLVPKKGANVVLAVDTSGSMAATDVAPDRLSAAQEAAETFLDRSPKDLQVGLVAFSEIPVRILPPTDDQATVRELVGLLKANGGTAMGDALLNAVEISRPRAGEGPASERSPEFAEIEKPPTETRRLEEKSPAAVVLLSDGTNTSGETTPLEAAQKAREQGIPVYTVALGTPEGVVEEFGGGYKPAPPDKKTLQRIAEITGGEFFASSSATDLARVYDNLGSSLGFANEKREVTLTFVAAAFALLTASGMLSVLWFNRLP
jgi:Ca-activated chloride channel family protein